MTAPARGYRGEVDRYELGGKTGSYLAVTHENRFIWGATAAMLLSLGESLTQQHFLE